MGIPKGEVEGMLDTGYPIHFPLRPPEESEEHAEVPRRLFAYFLVGEKVGLRSYGLPRAAEASPRPAFISYLTGRKNETPQQLDNRY